MQNTITSFIIEYFYYVFLCWIFLHILHRRYGNKAGAKRSANLYQAILIFILYIYALSLREFFTENDIYLIPIILAEVGVIYLFRTKILPYKLYCDICQKRMTLKAIFFQPKHYCDDCMLEELRQELKESEKDSEVSEEPLDEINEELNEDRD